MPQVVVPAPRSVDLKKTMKWIGAVRQRCDLDATMREELEAQINGAEQRLFILEGEEGRIRDEGDLLRGERNRLLAAIRADLDAYLKDRKGFVQECQPAPRPEDAEKCKRWAERLNRTRGEIFQRTDALRKQVEAFSRGGRNVETEAEDLHARVLVPLMNRIRATARIASEKLLDDHNAILKDLLVLKKSKDPKDRQKYRACAAQAEKILARREALEPLVDLRATVTPLAEGKLRAVMPALLEKRAAEVIPHLNKAMDEFEIVTPKRKAAFLAQLAHESGQLTKFTENLNYSAQGLRDQWPGRFTEEEAKTYARQQGKIANRAYAGRLGNGYEASGDGWKYRGRGVIHITGRDTYRAASIALGIDLLANPDLVENVKIDTRVAAWYWTKFKELNRPADQDDFEKITLRVSGSTDTLAKREIFYRRALKELGGQKPSSDNLLQP